MTISHSVGGATGVSGGGDRVVTVPLDMGISLRQWARCFYYSRNRPRRGFPKFLPGFLPRRPAELPPGQHVEVEVHHLLAGIAAALVTTR